MALVRVHGRKEGRLWRISLPAVASTALTTLPCLCVRSPRWFWMFRAVMVRSEQGGDRHCFRLIQTVQEGLQDIPAGCSFNNSRVAEVHVCGSYAREHSFLSLPLFLFLFDSRLFTYITLLQHGEEWRSIRCMCGTLCGRYQDRFTEFGETTTVYRLVKYAIRPVSPSAA